MQDDRNAIIQLRFPQKLWYLLNMKNDAILWGGTGRTILMNYRVLHNYLQCDHSIFKTTNISSFVRQLNLYGFRKVTSHLQDPLCNSSNPYMHEYVHDYFQYGRPELINKITRKALALRKNYKGKNVYGHGDHYLYITPLQKARQALHNALRKAAEDMFIRNSPKDFCNMKFECEESPEDFCEDEENIELDWILPKNVKTEAEPQLQTVTEQTQEPEPNPTVDSNNYGDSAQVQDLMNFNDEAQQNDSFPGQFLNMPDLDPEPTEDSSTIELLAEFNIDQDADQGIIRKLTDKNDHSMNCVLPSISNDHTDFVTMEQNETSDYHDGDWDQMVNDILASKGPNPESSSDLKELYSQISRTIDLLNC